MGSRQDSRRVGFFMIDNRIIDEEFEHLGFHGFCIYAALVRLHFRNRGIMPSYNELIELLGVSRMTISRVVRKLQGLRLIDVDKRPGKKSTYQLLDLTPYDYAGSKDGPYVQLHGTQQKVVAVDPYHQRTGSGSPELLPLVPPANYPGGPTGSGFKDSNTNTRGGDGGEVVLDRKFAPQHALLARHGVREPAASQLAPLLPIAQLECVVAYWLARAGGVKPVGPGLLVRMVEHPEGWGIRETPAGWRHPPLPTGRPSSPAAPPAAPIPIAERVSDTVGRRRQVEAELAKLSNDPGSLFNFKGRLRDTLKS